MMTAGVMAVHRTLFEDMQVYRGGDLSMAMVNNEGQIFM
jgi:hypothetical protein